MNFVSNSSLYPEPHLMDVLRTKGLTDGWEGAKTAGIEKRAFVVYDTNLCTESFKFHVCEGRVGTRVGDKSNASSPQVVVRFGFPFNMNHIELKLSDVRGDRFSYKLQY